MIGVRERWIKDGGLTPFDAQERYLTTLRDEIRAILARNGTMEEAVATVGASERDKWLLFEDHHPRNVVTGFAELEWE